MAAIYLDSSAIVKLAVREPESDALRRYLRTRHPRVSSALARAEVMRALLDKGESARKAGRRALAHLDLLRVDKRVLDLAGGLLPFELRTLDAIHLATAQRLGVKTSPCVRMYMYKCPLLRRGGYVVVDRRAHNSPVAAFPAGRPFGSVSACNCFSFALCSLGKRTTIA